VQYLPRYDATQRRRHEVRPGVTGLAQVNGRNTVSWEDKFAMDVEYVETRSLLLDAKILFLTFARVITRHGIDQEGGITMDEFMGSEASS
ncbi:MAG TPA: sugar transferase, partial [Marmoricola sp.]|nr:sugar transferase [Marmoricola sp.]